MNLGTFYFEKKNVQKLISWAG